VATDSRDAVTFGSDDEFNPHSEINNIHKAKDKRKRGAAANSVRRDRATVLAKMKSGITRGRMSAPRQKFRETVPTKLNEFFGANSPETVMHSLTRVGIAPCRRHR
jgi:hypothetical protein